MRLFDEFSPVGKADWSEQILKDLKGRSLESLQWKFEGGLSLNPIVEKEDISEEGEGRRGNFFNQIDSSWQIVQEVYIDDNEAVEQLKTMFQQEVQAVQLLSRESKQQAKWQDALAQIDFRYQAVHLKRDGISLKEMMQMIYAQLADNQIESKVLTGTMLRPAEYFHKAFLSENESLFAEEAQMLAEIQEKSPYFRALGIDLGFVHELGGTIVQQLGFGIALMVEYIEELSKAGVSKETIAKSMAFQFPISGNFFPEIAKLRAFRILISRVWEIYGLENEELISPFILAETSLWNKPAYDAYNNLLRCTTEAMSAVLGGAHALTVRAYNASFEENNEFSLRMARNIQHLLKYESYLDKVSDAGGGSYYIESLTDTFAEAAWALFQSLEKEGGYLASLRMGVISEKIRTSAAEKQAEIEKRKKVFVGINQYPNTEEVSELIDIEGFSSHRATLRFENLRAATDAYTQKTGKRPAAMLLQFGDIAMRNARALFSRNVIGCLGVSVNDWIVNSDKDLTISEMPNIIVLCSSDEEYFSMGMGIISILKAQYPNSVLVLAGKPENWENLGIAHNIFAGMNVLAFLKELQGEVIRLENNE